MSCCAVLSLLISSLPGCQLTAAVTRTAIRVNNVQGSRERAAYLPPSPTHHVYLKSHWSDLDAVGGGEGGWEALLKRITGRKNRIFHNRLSLTRMQPRG